MLKKGGFEIRVVELDGVSKMLDLSVKEDRLNFRVWSDFVQDVYGG